MKLVQFRFNVFPQFLAKRFNLFLLIIIAFSALGLLLNSFSMDDDSDAKIVVINELMALNSATIADQVDVYNDWRLLFNNSETATNLSDYNLSDNDNSIIKWEFPYRTTIEGNDYLAVCADNDTFQTGLQTCFKLSYTRISNGTTATYYTDNENA